MMNKKIIFLKQLTAAEVGNTRTHEKYVRLPNEFNHVEFFQSDLVENGSVLEKLFTAKNLTKGHENDEPITLRFAYFINNANQEKRIPSLGKLFEANDVCENDIVRLESIISSEGPSFYISFLKPNKMQISPKQFYCTFDEDEERREKYAQSTLPSLQRIYYGAPGTGKSHAVNELTKGKNVVRTTFHPDSDYSTFVGAYKPTMKKTGIKNAVGNEEEHIVYEFVPQAFLKAYVRAWENYPTPQYLVIEEINRGNCAQIFGDLFQLLDRDENGFSKYPIDSDEDIKKHIAKQGLTLANCEIDDKVKEAIYKGKIMLLPSNLYILATMNTSDQSLFPIDSAFKRRWDWVYVPIANVTDKKWRIVIGNKEYGWWNFLEKINEQIGATTNSEDKKLGFFFCQAKDGVIDAATFVSKVLFYLWNDVFKDYGFENDLFKVSDKEFLRFDLFYQTNAGETQVNAGNVELFLENLKVEYDEVGVSNQNESEDEADEADEDDSGAGAQGEETGDGYDRSRYSINGKGNFNKRIAVKKAVELYVSSHADKKSNDVLHDWLSLGIKQPSPFMLSHDEYSERRKNTRDNNFDTRFEKIAVGNDFIYVSNQWRIQTITEFANKVNQQDWGIHIKKV